jgi:L-lactate utilization protein LutB
MPSISKRWAEIERLLDQVLGQREAREQQRVAKIVRQRARHSARTTGSTLSGVSATRSPKARRSDR